MASGRGRNILGKEKGCFEAWTCPHPSSTHLSTFPPSLGTLHYLLGLFLPPRSRGSDSGECGVGTENLNSSCLVFLGTPL